MLKRILFISVVLLSIIILTNCGIKRMAVEEDAVKESNALLIEQAVQEAAAQVTTIPVLNTNSNFVVMSSEATEERDYPNISIIEDAIVSSLAKAGFNVLERDNDILVRVLYQEGKGNVSSVVIPPTTGQLDDKEEPTQLPKYNLDYGKKVQIVSSKVNPEIGNDAIKPADFIISYRILEEGIKYLKPNEVDEYGVSQLKRKAMVKLHIRIIDAKTSKIIWANNLEGVKEDFVPKWMVKKLEETGYQFYSQSLPLVNER